MSYPRSRSLRAVAALVFAIPVVLAGCDSKRPTMSGQKSGPAATSETNALAPLDTQQDFAHCRAALQQLDGQDGAAARPTLLEAEKNDVATLLNLTPAEAATIAQPTFTPADAAYLEECLLLRAGVRSLRIDARPPLEKGRLAFDWICRLVYADDRIPWPSNPWSTLEGGVGLAISRAYAILAAWQQLGLDGCLVGAPSLKTTRSVVLNPADPRARPSYAPVRACGVQVGSDLFLFDPATGKPFTTADGKDVLTLAKVNKNPDLVKAGTADEAATWQAFLAPPLPGVAKRMEWLEQTNPGGSGARLFVDVAALRVKIGGASVTVWNPDNDPYSATRVLTRYASDEPVGVGNPPLKESHKLSLLPLDQLPKTNVAITYLAPTFARPFERLRWSPGSPRDLLVRGQFADAMTALDESKKMAADARTRMDQDPNIGKAFERWADQFQKLQAQVLRSDPSDPNGVMAQKALDAFRNDRGNRDAETAFVLGHAARPLMAEANYLIAECVHERAERAQIEASASAIAQWDNAAEWWQWYLDAAAQAGGGLPARDVHARALRARCQELARKKP